MSEIAHLLFFALGEVYRIRTDEAGEVVLEFPEGMGIGAVGVGAGEKILSANYEVRQLLDHLRWGGIEYKDVVGDEGIWVRGAGAALVVLELYGLLELLGNGDRVARVAPRGIDDNVGERRVYWL